MTWLRFLVFTISVPFVRSDCAKEHIVTAEDVVALWQTTASINRRSSGASSMLQGSGGTAYRSWTVAGRAMEDAGMAIDEDHIQTLDSQASAVPAVQQHKVRMHEGGQNQLQLENLQEELHTVVMQRDQAMGQLKKSKQDLSQAKDALHKVLMPVAASTEWSGLGESRTNITDVAGLSHSVVVVVQNSTIDVVIMVFGVALFFILVAIFFFFALHTLREQQQAENGGGSQSNLISNRISNPFLDAFPAVAGLPLSGAQLNEAGLEGPGGSGSGSLAQATSVEDRREIVERNRRMVAQGVFFGSSILLLLVFFVLLIYLWFIIKYYIMGWWVWADTKDGTCDAPLSLWLFLSLLSFALRTLMGGEANPYLGMFWLVWDMGLFIMGMVWINSSTTCVHTNKELFWFVHGFLVFIIVRNVILIVVTFIALAVLIFAIRNGWFEGVNAANPIVIESMEVAKFADFKSQPEAPSECSICCTEWDDTEEIKKTPCNHYFHTDCLGKWLKNARTCPLCRLDLQEATEPGSSPGASPC